MSILLWLSWSMLILAHVLAAGSTLMGTQTVRTAVAIGGYVASAMLFRWLYEALK